ncbi:phosphoribosyltransferase [Sphingomonas solaris]|uniref:Phosphoribosyltransferase n=1 Tax=Alterirhizorhabdus solaris TaxID=2529389 RepID=A0A558QZ44_9SPHN|nr:phosphoribosyltransferase family protein [Sphingomonas solaris]TVV72434.1 phosphoribosyltransferase [Sphingomonas solaris]
MTTGQPVLSTISQDRFVADVQALATRLEEDGWQPDFIVGIGRGGLVPAAYLSHRTGIAMLSIDYSARVPGFADELLTKLAAMSAAGRRLLFLDDINDSGATLLDLRETLLAQGGDAANLRVAVLISNDRSRATVDYCARTIDRATDKQWYVFPWESVAPMSALIDEARDVPERLA